MQLEVLLADSVQTRDSDPLWRVGVYGHCTEALDHRDKEVFLHSGGGGLLEFKWKVVT